MVDQALLEQTKQLTPSDRLELIGALWDSIEADDMPVSEAVGALIDERIREANAAPLMGQLWEEVEAELRNRLK